MVFVWLAGPQRSFRGGAGRGASPTCAVNYPLTSLLICAGAAGEANCDAASQRTFPRSLVQFDPGAAWGRGWRGFSPGTPAFSHQSKKHTRKGGVAGLNWPTSGF